MNNNTWSQEQNTGGKESRSNLTFKDCNRGKIQKKCSTNFNIVNYKIKSYVQKPHHMLNHTIFFKNLFKNLNISSKLWGEITLNRTIKLEFATKLLGLLLYGIKLFHKPTFEDHSFLHFTCWVGMSKHQGWNYIYVGEFLRLSWQASHDTTPRALTRVHLGHSRPPLTKGFSSLPGWRDFPHISHTNFPHLLWYVQNIHSQKFELSSESLSSFFNDDATDASISIFWSFGAFLLEPSETVVPVFSLKILLLMSRIPPLEK